MVNSELKKREYSFYEVGQFFPSTALEGTKLYSIGQFKKMLGGERKEVLAGEMVLNEVAYFFMIILPGYVRKLIRFLCK